MEARIKNVVEVNIPEEVWEKMRSFTANFEDEVAGWLTGSREGNVVNIEELFIPGQEVSRAQVDIDQSGMVPLLNEIGTDKASKIVCHFHSHNSMGSFWSGVDEENMRKIMEPRGFFLFLVMGDKGKSFKLRAEVKSVVHVIMDDIQPNIIGKEADKFLTWCKEEWAKKVKVKTVNYASNWEKEWYRGYNGHGQSTFSGKTNSLERDKLVFFFHKKKKMMQINVSDEEMSGHIQDYITAMQFPYDLKKFRSSEEIDIQLTSKEEFEKVQKDIKGFISELYKKKPEVVKEERVPDIDSEDYWANHYGYGYDY